MAHIASSTFENSKLPHATNKQSCHMHTLHAFHKTLIDTNRDVQKTWLIMMDDAFIYHANTLFLLPIVCRGTRMTTSASTEHELTKRALESYLHMGFNKKIEHRIDLIPSATPPKCTAHRTKPDDKDEMHRPTHALHVNEYVHQSLNPRVVQTTFIFSLDCVSIFF
jgi:hypothetical protein